MQCDAERLAFDTYHWADDDGVVHSIGKVIASTMPRVHDRIFTRSFVETTEGEARTLCGLRLGNDKYYYTLDEVSCMCCLTGTHLGFRSIDSKGPPR